MDYRKPSKEAANVAYLASIGMVPGVAYQEEIIQQKKTFLIVCEGENTEPLYFEAFPVPSSTVVTEGGCGTKTALVKLAIQLKKQEEYEGREVWCVFDFDYKPDEIDTQPEDFNNAIKLARDNGMKVAWSNDAFELWFLLHYQDLESALTRYEIFPILKKKWGLKSFGKEAKTRDFCLTLYERHMDVENGAEQQLAIRRAKKLHKAYGSDQNFAAQKPCTTVYLLVQELNKNLKQ